MPKIAINLLRWNTSWEEIDKCIGHVLSSDYSDFLLVYMENADVGKTRLTEQVRTKYGNNPQIKIVDNYANLGYAGGHNKFFAETDAELLMVLNPDAHMEPSFLSEIVKAFEKPQVGMATGKMVKPEKNAQGEKILDGTGIIIQRSRRARERGQLEVDSSQYDRSPNVFGVSGTAAVFRKSALEAAKIHQHEYYDPDFFAYWEDLDLSWRLRLVGYQAKYVPSAVIYHTRLVGRSPGGYKNFPTFIKHHAKFSLNVRRWNWRNHLFAIIKNDFGWNFWKAAPWIAAREIAMFIYICIFEPRTLGAVPVFFRLLPRMLAKRKIIQRRRTVTSEQMSKWFN